MSGFWIRKIKTLFRRLDFDRSGLLTADDIELMASKFAEGATDDRKALMREKAFQLYNAIERVAGSAGQVTEQQMIDSLKSLRNEPQFPVILDELGQTCLHLLDTNGDGFIQLKEYIRFFYNVSIPDPESLAKIAFEGLDTDHNGKLSHEEMKVGFSDFMMSEDEGAPGTLFWGPLV